jgi:hypothetical protein
VGERFSTPVETGPGADPASYTMGTRSFPGVKRPGRGVGHPPRLAPRLKKEWSYTSTHPVTCCRVNFTFTFTLLSIILSSCRHVFTASKTQFTVNLILLIAILFLDILQFYIIGLDIFG